MAQNQQSPTVENPDLHLRARRLPWSAATGESISPSNVNLVAKDYVFRFGGGNCDAPTDRLEPE